MFKQIKKNILITTDLKRICLRSVAQNNVTGTNTSAADSIFKNENVPNKSRVVICGSGIIGCSVAYHLSKINGLSFAFYFLYLPN